MSKLWKVGGAAAACITPILITYYLDRNVPDVRYTLSDKIPTSLGSSIGATPETVQQLEVKNIGNALANKLVVKIKRPVATYSIAKYSAADAVQTFANQQPFEIVYPQLPPQAGFKMVLTSPGDGIEYTDVQISHEAGIGSEALSKTGGLNGVIFWLAYSAGFFVWIIMGTPSLRRGQLELWKMRKRSSPREIIQSNKPWYVFEKEWPQLRMEALKEGIEKEGQWRNIENSAAYQFLLLEDLGTLQGSERHEATESAMKTITSAYAADINSAYTHAEIVKLLRIKRPYGFNPDKWNDLENKANVQYVALRKRGTIYSAKEAFEKLDEKKPPEINDQAWSELCSHWKSQYAQHLLFELAVSERPLEFVQNTKTDAIDDESIKLTWHRWASLVQRQHLFDRVMKAEAIGEVKPAELREYEWDRLKEIEALLTQLRDVQKQKRENDEATAEVVADQKKIANLREKRDRQLRLIQELLEDPASLDRVEADDDTFAPGNWVNLRRLAQLLAESQPRSKRPRHVPAP